MSRFRENLIRVGMVIGMWLAIGAVAVSNMATACGMATGGTVLTIGLVAWDARKARKRYGR